MLIASTSEKRKDIQRQPFKKITFIPTKLNLLCQKVLMAIWLLLKKSKSFKSV